MNPRTERTAFVIGGLGLLACLAGALFDTTQFLRSYLWAYWFWLGAAIGCGQPADHAVYVRARPPARVRDTAPV